MDAISIHHQNHFNKRPGPVSLRIYAFTVNLIPPHISSIARGGILFLEGPKGVLCLSYAYTHLELLYR